MKRQVAAGIVLAAALAGAAFAWLATRVAPPPALEQATLFAAARPVPSLSLTDQAGQPFGRERLARRWTLMFFGFTNCPDICPTTLATLARARKLLADLPPAHQPQVVFVSVDPGRDTPTLLASYVGHFDAGFAAVTGTPEAIATLTGELGVAVLIGAPAQDGSYPVDHTAAIFLIDPTAAFTGVFASSAAAEVIARDYRRILARRG